MDAQNIIIINGNEFSFDTGETILQIANRNHIDIPTLCHLKGATPTGSCRICVVEVEGARTLVASCAAPATNNMVVRTESPQVIEARKMLIELLLSSGNHNCSIRGSDGDDWTQFQLKVQMEDGSSELCPVWGDCQLQDLAYRYQVSGEKFSATETAYPMETVNPFIVRDFSRCINCGRCVQACNEIQVNHAINFGYRGSKSKIIAAGDRPLKDSDCIFCGECVQACPVGALVEKEARYNVRPWETKTGPNHLQLLRCRVPALSACEKKSGGEGYRCGECCTQFRQPLRKRTIRISIFINSLERLKTPLIKANGTFRDATWKEAIDLVLPGDSLQPTIFLLHGRM